MFDIKGIKKLRVLNFWIKGNLSAWDLMFQKDAGLYFHVQVFEYGIVAKPDRWSSTRGTSRTSDSSDGVSLRQSLPFLAETEAKRSQE